MTAKRIDGKAAAATIREAVASFVPDFVRRVGRAPGLATVLVGEDPASDGCTVFASKTQPSGVHGTSAGRPEARRPALTG